MLLLNRLSIRNKTLMLAFIGCVGLIFNLAYYAWTSSINEGRLNTVREVYFPILEDTDHAIAALEDLEPALREAAGNIEVLEDAQEFVWIINERLDSIMTTDPTQSGRAEELRRGVEEYVDLASSFAQRVDAGKVTDFAVGAETITDKLIETAALFTEYRKHNFDRFIAGIAEVQAEARLTLWVSVIVAASIVSGLVFAGFMISNLMTRSLSRLVAFAREVAGGDLDSTIEVASKDEIGQLSSALTDMQTDLRERIEAERQSAEESDKAVNETVRVFGALASGDLNQKIESDYQGSFAVLKTDANATVSKLSAVIEDDIQLIVRAALRGDLSQRIDLEDKKGFFKTLSQGVNELVEVSENVIKDTVHLLGAMSRGDLTETIEKDYEGLFGKLKTDANATVAKLTEVVGNIQSTSTSVKTGADEMSQGNANLSQRTEEQAASLEETASSMEEMTSTVKQNADNAGEANQLAMAAREQAEKGGTVVSQAVEAMKEINASSKRISDIIGVIDEIAFQTNLLALNAAVEAARAGDQGRGFAVVASEVRNLAGRSATAAKEIKDLIVDSAAKVDEGSRLVNESGETLQEIVNGVKKVTDIVGEIAAASSEQSAGIDQVNKAIVQLDELTQQNAALVEEVALASESMGEQADDLNQMMAFFTVEHDAPDRGAATGGSPQHQEERRSAKRPWAAPQTDGSTPQTKATAGGGDQEWEAF